MELQQKFLNRSKTCERLDLNLRSHPGRENSLINFTDAKANITCRQFRFSLKEADKECQPPPSIFPTYVPSPINRN
jgi:hypothetical protein